MQGNEGRYLLRLWSESDGDETWRATLRDLHSDDTWNFASIGQLVAYLAELTGTPRPGETE